MRLVVFLHVITGISLYKAIKPDCFIVYEEAMCKLSITFSNNKITTQDYKVKRTLIMHHIRSKTTCMYNIRSLS